jgi:hypothetical protein
LNVFGTAGYELDIGVVGARFAQYTAVTAIAPGHIIAVRVAHVVALRDFPDRRRATRSQYPMLVLMIGYTMPYLMSVWSQPRTPARRTAGRQRGRHAAHHGGGAPGATVTLVPGAGGNPLYYHRIVEIQAPGPGA